MKRCPACQEWTLDYDEYFGRFRCFNPSCDWMASSSAELELNNLESQNKPKELSRTPIKELGLTLTSFYDEENDALLFDFGLQEPAVDLPEPDGRMVWKIGSHSGSVTGFVILGVKKLGVAKVQVNFDARKELIERRLKLLPGALSSGRPTKILIQNVTVTAHSVTTKEQEQTSPLTNAYKEALEKFHELQETCE